MIKYLPNTENIKVLVKCLYKESLMIFLLSLSCLVVPTSPVNIYIMLRINLSILNT